MIASRHGTSDTAPITPSGGFAVASTADQSDTSDASSITPSCGFAVASTSTSRQEVSDLDEGFLASSTGTPLASSTQTSEIWSECSDDLIVCAQQAEEKHAQENDVPMDMTVSPSM